jgi:hypothetical protein
MQYHNSDIFVLKVCTTTRSLHKQTCCAVLCCLVPACLQFVIQTHPGSLYISLIDDTATSASSSNADAAYYLDLLQLLLTPLQVPVLITQDSRLANIDSNFDSSSRKHMLRDAAARNAAVGQFFWNKRATSSCVDGAQGVVESEVDVSHLQVHSGDDVGEEAAEPITRRSSSSGTDTGQEEQDADAHRGSGWWLWRQQQGGRALQSR